jgi:hypothetical protein
MNAAMQPLLLCLILEHAASERAHGIGVRHCAMQKIESPCATFISAIMSGWTRIIASSDASCAINQKMPVETHSARTTSSGPRPMLAAIAALSISDGRNRGDACVIV